MFRGVRSEQKFLLNLFGFYVPKLTFQGQNWISGGLKRVLGGGMRKFLPRYPALFLDETQLFHIYSLLAGTAQAQSHQSPIVFGQHGLKT
ncbi:hypothetical protein QL285_062318 [Trifolium repens]|nr:hypothetical protein QL285_062318 [Trifolium repens]